MFLRTQFTRMLAMPIIALLVLGLWASWSARQELRGGLAARNQAEVAVRISALVHTLQVERGQFAGFRASGGRNFANTLPGERALTDHAHSVLGADIAGRLIAVDDLSEMHARVDAGAVSGARWRASTPGRSTLPWSTCAAA